MPAGSLVREVDAHFALRSQVPGFRSLYFVLLNFVLLFCLRLLSTVYFLRRLALKHRNLRSVITNRPTTFVVEPKYSGEPRIVLTVL